MKNYYYSFNDDWQYVFKTIYKIKRKYYIKPLWLKPHKYILFFLFLLKKKAKIIVYNLDINFLQISSCISLTLCIVFISFKSLLKSPETTSASPEPCFVVIAAKLLSISSACISIIFSTFLQFLCQLESLILTSDYNGITPPSADLYAFTIDIISKELPSESIA